MLKYLVAAFVLLSFSGCDRPRGFALKKIISKHPNDSRWDAPTLSEPEKEELDALLSKPFTYLGSGNHCYVFASFDGKYVLKFFKQKHMRTQSFIDYLPFVAKDLLQQTSKQRRRKKERDKSFTSYKIAYLTLKKETGIFYLHLNKSSHLKKKVLLIDQHGSQSSVAIDNMEFLIQKRAQVGFDRLSELLKTGQKEAALNSISSLMHLIINRMEKGVFDKDTQIFKNFGFINNQAIELDVGEFRIDPSQCNKDHMKKEASTIALQLKEWAKFHHPEYFDEIDQTIEELIDQIGQQ